MTQELDVESAGDAAHHVLMMDLRFGLMAVLTITATVHAGSPIPYPHPQITEVLFNVPSGAKGDANGDGERDATGDEFIEIANPHDRPISLGGYILTNRLASPTEEGKKGVRFVFPDVTLGPGELAVVFNGHKWIEPEGIGSADRAPTRPVEHCGAALVFSMRNTSPSAAMRNTGDYILLSDPEGAPIDCVTWGECDPEPPRECLRIQSVAANPKGSVQRLTPSSACEPHVDINGKPCSPGLIPRRTGR